VSDRIPDLRHPLLLADVVGASSGMAADCICRVVAILRTMAGTRSRRDKRARMNSPAPVPATPAPITVGAAPWWTSTDQKLKIATGVAVLVLAFPKSALVAKWGLSNPDQVTNYINAASVVAPLATLAWGFIARIYSKIQPLTLTRAAAASNTATIAVVQTQAAMRQHGIPTSVERQAQLEASAVSAAAVVTPTPQTVTALSPEVIGVIASAVVAEIAKQQAMYKASHPLPLLAPSGTTPPIPPTAIYPNPTPGATPHASSPTPPAAT
jgi:hypothetical protein